MIPRILTMVVLLGGLALAQSDHHEGSHSDHAEGSHSEHHEKGLAAYPCPMLQTHHEQMTQKMAEMDKKVSQLAKEMKQTQGEQKIQVMESLLNTLVEQRGSIHEEMVAMMPKMG